MAMGIFLIVLGASLLLYRGWLWKVAGEAFVAVIGLMFLALFFIGNARWAIYPGAFTTTVGTVIYLAAKGWPMNVYWPLFVMAPGVSFLLIRLAAPEEKWAVYPGTIITVIGLSLFTLSTGFFAGFWRVVGTYWPLGLIAAGALLVLRSRK